MIEPVSKQDSLRVLDEAGIAPVSYATVKRRLPLCGRTLAHGPGRGVHGARPAGTGLAGAL